MMTPAPTEEGLEEEAVPDESVHARILSPSMAWALVAAAHSLGHRLADNDDGKACCQGAPADREASSKVRVAKIGGVILRLRFAIEGHSNGEARLLRIRSGTCLADNDDGKACCQGARADCEANSKVSVARVCGVILCLRFFPGA